MQTDAQSNTDDLLPFVELVCSDIHRQGLGDALISGYLVMQLVALTNMPRPGIDIMTILDVIKDIETVPAQARRRVSPFRQQIALQGLFKAHFYDTAFMAKNIQAGLNQSIGVRRQALLDKYGLTEGQIPSAEQLSELSRELISGTLDNRAESDKGLTGEWIVMDQENGRYRYLCLATHELARNHPDVLVEEADKGRESMLEFKKIYHWAVKQSKTEQL